MQDANDKLGSGGYCAVHYPRSRGHFGYAGDEAVLSSGYRA